MPTPTPSPRRPTVADLRRSVVRIYELEDNATAAGVAPADRAEDINAELLALCGQVLEVADAEAPSGAPTPRARTASPPGTADVHVEFHPARLTVGVDDAADAAAILDALCAQAPVAVTWAGEAHVVRQGGAVDAEAPDDRLSDASGPAA